MDPSSEGCFFDWKFTCKEKNECLISATAVRIRNIVSCSKIYGDGKHDQLQESLDKDGELTIQCHKSCVSTYTSKQHTARHKRQNEDKTSCVPRKRTRRSSSEDSNVFDFKKHCVFCGLSVELEKNPKNPGRWRQAYLIRELNAKQQILNVCDARNDKLAACVRCRVDGALSDLHAADARYHADCRQRFLSFRSVGENTETTKHSNDGAFESVVNILRSDTAKSWNPIDLHKAYVDNGGNTLSRRSLVEKLKETFGEDLLVLSSPGLASIIIFRSAASKTLRLVNDDQEDDTDIAISKVGKLISKEVSAIQMDKEHYDIGIDKHLVKESVSDSLLALLARVSPKLDSTLPSLLIGSIVTSVVTGKPTPLQISLAMRMGQSKTLIKDMNLYGVTCSYDESRRFRKSAAKVAVENSQQSSIAKADDGLVQVIVDNFDADISSQNGKVSTHSLAVLLTQPEVPRPDMDEPHKIKRVSKEELSQNIAYDVAIHRYNGPKVPEMPEQTARSVMSLKLLAHQAIVKKRAQETDFSFFQDIVKEDNCPEFNGYNTKLSREQGHNEQPKTKAIYQPLIDMKPSDPDTMMTAMMEGQTLTRDTGQKFTVLTCDQQLYRVAVQVLWAFPEKFPEMYLRLGGMHALMSFVGAIGTLMDETGLSDVLSDVFGGVAKMLNGKKFPQNVRALRLLTEEILRNLNVNKHECAADLMQELSERAQESKTAKLWVDVLVKPVFLMMAFIRAEREGDWLLHLSTFREMLPYYFAAGHANYARYGLLYLRTMEQLPSHVLQHFMKGEHVTRHLRGTWNGLWTDMFIETTFMRFGHSKEGIVGITLKPEALKVWALSRHLCCRILSSLNEMEEGGIDRCQMTHKEEGKARIEADAKDREGLRRKLETCIDPLESKSHPAQVVNIASGKLGTPAVNVYDAVSIGEKQLADFERSWPQGFHKTIPRKVVNMSAVKKHVTVGETRVIDLNAIYARVIGLQASESVDIDIKDVISHELAPVPTAIFTEDGLRISKTKSVLKRLLQVEVSDRNAEKPDVVVIDGSALLWTIHWPTDGTTADYIVNVKSRIQKYLEDSHVYLVFDRYRDFSTKSVARSARETGATRVYQLNMMTKLPAQNVVLTASENKRQLVELIVGELVGDKTFHIHSTKIHKLVVTGEQSCAVEIQNDEIRQRKDLETSHEEADNIIVQQVLRCAGEAQSISVVSDDTDVFVLLMYYFQLCNLQIPVMMESPCKERSVVDVKQSVEKHAMIVKDLPAAHALSGCDTTGSYFGIGKATIKKVLEAGTDLTAVGDSTSSIDRVISQATSFISACYGQSNCASMSQTRLLVWAKRNGKGCTSSPKLCSLPPTTAAFAENVKRAHYQTILWKSLQGNNPPVLNPEDFGWQKDLDAKSMSPVTVPKDVKLVPDNILQLIRCGCKSDRPCSKKCTCKKLGLPTCTVFCACYSVGCGRESK